MVRLLPMLARLRGANARFSFSCRFPCLFARLRSAKARVNFSCRFPRPFECFSTAKARPFWYYQLRLRPTPATRFDHLATSLGLRPYQLPTPTIITNFIYALVNTINKLSSSLYCYLVFVSFIVFWLSLLACLNS